MHQDTWHGSSKYFKSEEVLWNQKLRDESKAAFIWKERRGSKHIVNKVKERQIQKGKLKRISRSDFTSISKIGELDEIGKSYIKGDVRLKSRSDPGEKENIVKA